MDAICSLMIEEEADEDVNNKREVQSYGEEKTPELTPTVSEVIIDDEQ